MSQKIIFLFCSLLFCTCKSTNSEYWNISKFNLKPGSLKDNSEIVLIYTSQRPSDFSELEYYIHIIAFSKETGDTFNILTASDNDFKKEDSSGIFAYFDENNIVTKATQLAGDDTHQFTDSDLISNIKVRRPTKVVRNPQYDYLADNKFPTVIGSIGLRTIPK